VGLLRRRDEQPGLLAVTGASGPLARAFLERCEGDVLAVEEATDPRLQEAGTVVHLGGDGTPLLDLPRLRRLVLCSTAGMYGARPDNPVPMPDASALRGHDDPELAEHVATERLAEQARTRGVTVTLLRPAAVVGLPDTPEGPLLRQLAASRLLAVRGVEPLWQLCHLEDLLDVLELGATAEAGGDFGVACEGFLTQLEVERLAGRRRLEVPEAFAVATLERLQRIGVTHASVRELDHLLGPLVLECDGLRAAGWKPRWTNEEALQAHLLAVAGRSTGASAYRAAGATVAVLGTAVLVRQARRRRRT
jgi:hypothetical protein